MYNTSSKVLIFFLRNAVVWTVAGFIFNFFRFFGIPENFTTVDFEEFVPFWTNFILGFMAALFYTGIELLFELPKLKRWSFRTHMIGKFVLSFFAVKFMMVIAYYTLTFYHGTIALNEMGIIEFLRSKMYWVVLLFFLLTAGLISFIRQVDQKFGPGIIWNMLRGKYHRPREEERIFMFIDLKSSTTIAEELGNIRYSKFIQDCFYDLNDIFPKYDARVYQYVGDEAVLTWHPQRGVLEHKCIQCFEAFSERLEEKRDYYLSTYGHAPQFKAGAHAGPIVITEVGIVKKELAYHGDVINTTARIQSMCNTFDQKLLISQELLDKLPEKEKLQYAFQSKLQLRGKHEETAIYSVS